MRQQILDAGKKIRKGEVVAFPTETVYGLGANALDPDAVKKIFKTKGRPSDNPIIVHISSTEMLHKVVRSIPPAARKLIRKYWPGPLTIIFPRHPDLPYEVTAGLDTVAVRMPAKDIALALINAAGVPIAAPSANKSGSPSPTRSSHVKKDFPNLTVIDGGTCEHGLESTVISVERRPTILRLGAVTLEELQDSLPNVVLAEKHLENPPSPGMKYKHYSPKQKLTLFQHDQIAEMQKYILNSKSNVVVICLEEFVNKFPSTPVISLGEDDKSAAGEIFHALRHEEGDEFVVLGLEKKGHGRSVMDRLERASDD